MAKRKHGTLTADVVATVTIDASTRVEVINRTGTDEISFTTNGDTPTKLGDDTYVVPAVVGARLVLDGGSSITTVKLISGSAEQYSVEGRG